MCGAVRFLKKAGDDVEILTTDDKENAATSVFDYPITTTSGFRFPLYNHVRYLVILHSWMN